MSGETTVPLPIATAYAPKVKTNNGHFDFLRSKEVTGSLFVMLDH
jgi:hypothetical protein